MQKHANVDSYARAQVSQCLGWIERFALDHVVFMFLAVIVRFIE